MTEAPKEDMIPTELTAEELDTLPDPTPEPWMGDDEDPDE